MTLQSPCVAWVSSHGRSVREYCMDRDGTCQGETEVKNVTDGGKHRLAEVCTECNETVRYL